MNAAKIALFVLVNPIRGFRVIKEEREKFKYTPIMVLFLIIMMARIISIYFTHYPLATLHARDTNIGLELTRMIIPLLTWSVGCYAMTTILEGKTLFREQLASTAFAMMPYIVLTPIITLVSHMMSENDAALFYNFEVAKWIWIVVLFFIATATMNEYGFFKTVGISFLGLLTVLIIWLLCGLFYSLTDQIIVFAKELFNEIKLMFSE